VGSGEWQLAVWAVWQGWGVAVGSSSWQSAVWQGWGVAVAVGSAQFGGWTGGERCLFFLDENW